jgi:ATP-dependent helicase HrpB
MPVVEEWLNPAERPLVNQYAPERFTLPSGSSAKLRYEEDGSVVLPAVLQQLYDVSGKQLRIGDGRIPLKIEILAPSRRPVQITSDLDAFWQTSYPAVKKDLKGRYPKHEWR